jgi:hypothetical protein
MELTALRRKFSQWSDEQSQDFTNLLESIDEFREQAELLELDLRKDRDATIEVSNLVFSVTQELLKKMMASGVLQSYVLDAILDYGYAQLRGTLEWRAEERRRQFERENGNFDLDDHPF